MAFFMVRKAVWDSLLPQDAEQVRSAESVRLGEMPIWVDERDGSYWYVASDQRTQGSVREFVEVGES